jgi:xylose isomerase
MKKPRAHFADIPSIAYEGPKTENALAFRHYNPDEMIDGKSMADHLRFSIAYWHAFRGTGSDPFGPGTIIRPWENGKDAVSVAKTRMDAAFEFFQKIRAPFYCFHDRDIAPEGRTLAESNKFLDAVVAHAYDLQRATGIKLLWGTANLFSNPRYLAGASTNPDAHVFAYAAAQVKKALEVTQQLGGENYVFWGGREGYETLLNTNLKREQDHLAAFLHMAVDYAKSIGFKGQFLIEPKPKEPTKHQYDFDVASGIAFLRTYGLDKHFKFNVETNHATLAGHSFQHEIEVAAAAGMLGSIDANAGDLLLGWDTDQFNTDVRELSTPTSASSRWQWFRFSARADWAPAASTSTQNSAVPPLISKIFSMRTSAGWTLTRSLSKSRGEFSRTASSSKSSPNVTRVTIPASAGKSKPVAPISANWKNWC